MNRIALVALLVAVVAAVSLRDGTRIFCLPTSRLCFFCRPHISTALPAFCSCLSFPFVSSLGMHTFRCIPILICLTNPSSVNFVPTAPNLPSYLLLSHPSPYHTVKPSPFLSFPIPSFQHAKGAHTLWHTHTHCDTHTHTQPINTTQPNTLTHSHTHTLTHSHTQTLILTHSHSFSLILTPSLSLTHSLSFSLTHTYTYTPHNTRNE